jgi:hypothetical protein
MSWKLKKGSKQQRRLSGVCSLGGAAVDLEGNSPVQLCRRRPEKVQRPGGQGLRHKPNVVSVFPASPEPEPTRLENRSQASRSSSDACSAWV